MLRHLYLPIVLFAFLGVLAFAGRDQRSKGGWVSLFNGKDLSGWDTYLAPPRDSNGKKISDQPIGLNNDPRQVFTVVTDGGEKVIRISGDGTGAVITQKEYSDYHLQLMFRWGVLQWGAKKHKKKDSGLLYHSVGPYGADGGAWMRSHEFQVEEGDCGEYWGCAGGMADIPAVKKTDSGYEYDPGGQLYTFSVYNAIGRHCYKRGDAEHPTGEWNTLDLYCHGDTSVHMVNGRVMMVLYHLAQSDSGKVSPLARGRIQLQSEGAESILQADKDPAYFADPDGYSMTRSKENTIMDYKREAAAAALMLIRPGGTVGFGAGSTMIHLIDLLDEDKELSGSLTVLSSSFTTRELLRGKGFVVAEAGWTVHVDLYFDGCDQFDRRLSALKSGGGVHTSEKVLAAMAEEFILVGDAGKRVERLGVEYPLVLEVIPEALAYVSDRVQRFFQPVRLAVRRSDKKDGAVITERGNFLIDCWFDPFPEPAVINDRLLGIPGILEHSLFYNLAHRAIVAGPDGIRQYSRSGEL